jgi:hypothetical protein
MPFIGNVITAATVCILIWQVRVMTDTEARQFRAYVTVPSMQITPIKDGAFQVVSYRVEAIMKNSGATPTVGLRWVGYPRTRQQYEAKPDARPPVFRDDEGMNRELIGPNLESYPAFILAVNTEQVDEVRKQTYCPIFAGRIDYRDAITDKRRRTDFCFRMRYDPVYPEELGFRSCGGNTNCADEECYKTEPLPSQADICAGR